MPYFHQIDGVAYNFWSIHIEECTIRIDYGKIGAYQGNSSFKDSIKILATPEKAQKEYNKLIQQRIDKGYFLPNINARPNNEIHWTPELLAALPNSSSVELVLKPLDAALLAVIINDKENPLQELQTEIEQLIKENNQPNTTPKSSAYKWAHGLQYFFPTSVYNTQDALCYWATSVIIERALIVLGTCQTLDILLKLFSHCRLRNENYVGFHDSLMLVRHQISKLLTIDYQQALEVAQKYFAKETYQLDIVIIFLFPQEKAWTKEIIEHIKAKDYLCSRTPVRGYGEQNLRSQLKLAIATYLYACPFDMTDIKWLQQANCYSLSYIKHIAWWMQCYGINCIELIPELIKQNTVFHSVSSYAHNKSLHQKFFVLLSSIQSDDMIDLLMQNMHDEITLDVLYVQCALYPAYMQSRLEADDNTTFYYQKQKLLQWTNRIIQN